jgi:hypothetical protein
LHGNLSLAALSSNQGATFSPELSYYMYMKRGLALTLLALATSVVVSAQIHGVPPSVTSLGPGRSSTPGVHASITSLGPRGYGFSRGSTFGRGPIITNGVRSRGFHRHYLPYVGGYYWPYYGLDYPWFGDYDSSAYQQALPNQPVVVVVDPKSGDDRYGDHDFNEQRSQPAQAPAPPAPAEEQEPTVLVFRDGHQQEVRNYAIIGQMLWDFGSKGTHKIPLSDLDLDTTRKLNDDRGVDFVLPKS